MVTGDTYENEDPAPAVVAAYTFHVRDACGHGVTRGFSSSVLGKGDSPHAKMPPKAPASDAQLKKSEMRYWRSSLLYHMER